MHIYLLALAITGSTRSWVLQTERLLGTDSTDYITAPWDTLAAYYFKAVKAAASTPEGSRLVLL